MNNGDDISGGSDLLFPLEATALAIMPEIGLKSIAMFADDLADKIPSYDFSNPPVLSPAQMRYLRLHGAEFTARLAAKLSQQLHLEVALKLSSLRPVSESKLAAGWNGPSHFSLFKLEPMCGVSVLEITNELGSALMDRLMGGPGVAPEGSGEMSEIEKVLLEQMARTILCEWCAGWPGVKQLQPIVLGYESQGQFVQGIEAGSMLLTVSLNVRLGQCAGQMHLTFPLGNIESLLRQTNIDPDSTVSEAAVAPRVAAPVQRKETFDEIPVALTAEWPALELTAQEVSGLKVGDTLHMNLISALPVQIKLADQARFLGRPGTISGRWAVELTEIIER